MSCTAAASIGQNLEDVVVLEVWVVFLPVEGHADEVFFVEIIIQHGWVGASSALVIFPLVPEDGADAVGESGVFHAV